MIRTLRLTLLLSAMIFFYGCALAWLGVGAGLGVGAYKYIQGSVERDYPLEFGSAWEVTNTALANRYISVTNSVNEGLKGKIEALQRNGKIVIINLRYLKEDTTTVNIRVGFFGSYEEAEIIHEEIKSVAELE